MNGTTKFVPLIFILVLSNCSTGSKSVPVVPPPNPATTAPATTEPTPPAQIGAVNGVDISGCWKTEDGKSKISFSAIGTDLYLASYGDNTAWQVTGNKFAEISNPFKVPPTYPKDQKHSVGTISSDITSITRNLVASPTTQTFIRCQ